MTTVDTRVEHEQVAGWGGSLEHCGVECACGTTFDGFDTLAEAVELLDRHIAFETSAAPEPAPQPKPTDAEAQQRAGYIAGLRALADALESHPELQLPYDGTSSSISIYPHRNERAQLAAWARVLPGRSEKVVRDKYFDLVGSFHGLKIEVTCHRDEVCERVVLGTRKVTEKVPDPAALAAVPKVTVTKTIDDVEWICRPLLDEARVGAS